MTVSQLEQLIANYAEKKRDVSVYFRVRITAGRTLIEHWEVEIPRAERGVSVRRPGGEQ